MTVNPGLFIESANFASTEVPALEGVTPVNLDKLPDGVVSGTTLLDFSRVPDMQVRSAVSLALLFASQVANKAMKDDDDEDDWLAAYTANLAHLGFTVAGIGVVDSKFKKSNLSVHKAIIPFLTMAFGGAVTIGPVIIKLLQNLQEMNKDSPWITLFDRETRRFRAREMHFAAVNSNDSNTSITYAIARLSVDMKETSILFFKLSKTEAHFESSTTTMSVANALLGTVEPKLRERLVALTSSFIAEAEL